MRIATFYTTLAYMFLPLVVTAQQPDEVPAWFTTDWLMHCAVIDTSTDSEYRTAPTFDYQNCDYIHEPSGEPYSVSEEESTRILEALHQHSERMSQMRFRMPKIDRATSWPIHMYPGDCHCDSFEEEDCCETRFRPDLQAVYSRNKLYVRSIGPVSSEKQSLDIAHQLFHAVKAKYFPFDDVTEENHCQPFCWIGEGMASAIAYSGGLDADPPSERKFDESLFTDDYLKAQQTGRFWMIAGGVYDPRIFSRVLEQDYSVDGGSTGHGVLQVHQALLASGVDHGFFSAFGSFARSIQDDKYYSEVPRVDLEELESDVHIEFEEIQPISVQAARVKIDSRQLRQSIGENARVVLRAELECENENMHLLVDGVADFPDNIIEKDITEEFRENDMIEAWIQLINVHPDEPHNTPLQQLCKVKIKIDVMECTMAPKDVTKMVYIGKNKKGKAKLKMTYSLNTTEESAGMTKGKFNVHMKSYNKDRTIAKAWTDFTCTDEGITLLGTEMGYVPNVGGAQGSMEVDITHNTHIIPHKLEPGARLDDAVVRVEARMETERARTFGFDLVYNITERYVIGPETVICEAGTFEAHRIEYNTSASINFSGTASILNISSGRFAREAEASNVIWIAEGLGWVKQEITNYQGTMVYELVKVVR